MAESLKKPTLETRKGLKPNVDILHDPQKRLDYLKQSYKAHEVWADNIWTLKNDLSDTQKRLAEAKKMWVIWDAEIAKAWEYLDIARIKDNKTSTDSSIKLSKLFSPDDRYNIDDELNMV